MRIRSTRLIKMLALLLCFSAVAFAQSDEDALRAIVGAYFDAYARKDWPAMAALWDARSPFMGERYEALSRQFAENELRFSAPAISRVKVEGDKASLRVSTRRTALGKDGNPVRLTDVRIEMSFLRVNGQWKVWNEASPLAGLLSALAVAGSEDEQRRLLTEEADLATRELLLLLVAQSDRAYALADYGRALNLLQSQILIAERLNDRNELSDAWHKSGIILFLQKRYDDALAAYHKSMAIEEASGRKYELARAYNSIGLLYLGQGKFAESLDHFGRALELYEALDKKSEITQTVENIGNVHYEQGDYARAVEYYRRCVRLRDEEKKATQAAHLVLKIARVESEQGHDMEALALYRQAAERLASAGDRRSLGYAFHSAANVLYDEGDYHQALGLYQRSLQAERDAGTREGEASALQGIGLIHALNGNHALALEAYEQNLRVAQALADLKALAAAWQKVGGAHFSLGKYDDALNAYKEARAVRDQLDDEQETALALLDLGVTFAAKQDFPNALDHYVRSGERFAKANNHSGMAATLVNTALVYYQQNDYAQSLAVANRAAESASRADDQDLLWQARHRAGKALFRMNDLGAARKLFNEAIAIIETMRPQTSRQPQPRFYENKVAPYSAMVDLALAEGQGNEAFQYAERARARVLTGVLQNAKTQIVKTMTPREQDRERQWLGEITRLTAQLYREQERERPSRDRISGLTAQLQKARNEYADFRARLYALRPQLKALRGETKPLTVELAARLVTDQKTALLEFVETDERVYLFVFTKDATKPAQARRPPASSPTILKIFALGTTRGDLYTRLTRFNEALATRDAGADALARDLYDLLLKDARPVLDGKAKLIIAPDAVSWNLPFQALRSETGRYLIEDFAVVYTPSLTAFQAITGSTAMRGMGRAAARTGTLAELLALANPTLSSGGVALLKAALGADQTATLAESEREIAELGKLYGNRQSVLLTGADASEDRIKAEIGKYRIVHLAVPVLYHEASPVFSLLALAPGAEAGESGNDGLLDLRELLRLELKADVVVVSAGQWARPHVLSGRAMTAWTWAWFVAGSPATLFSQWRVEAPATTELMREFHRQASSLQSKSNATAWQMAVKELLARGEFSHPYFWAGYTLVGEGK